MQNLMATEEQSCFSVTGCHFARQLADTASTAFRTCKLPRLKSEVPSSDSKYQASTTCSNINYISENNNSNMNLINFDGC
jgi:hypothetical protein